MGKGAWQQRQHRRKFKSPFCATPLAGHASPAAGPTVPRALACRPARLSGPPERPVARRRPATPGWS